MAARVLMVCLFTSIWMPAAALGKVLYRNTFDTPLPSGGDPTMVGSEGAEMESGLITVPYASDQGAPPGGIELTLPGMSEPDERRIEMSFPGGGTDISNSFFITYSVGPGAEFLLPPLPAGATFGARRSGYIIRLIRHGDGSNEIKFYRADGGWTDELKSDWTLPFNPVTTLRRLEILHRKNGEHLIAAQFDTGVLFKKTYTFQDSQYPPGADRRGLQVIAKGHAGVGNMLYLRTDTWLVTDATRHPSGNPNPVRNAPGPPKRRAGPNLDPEQAMANARALYEKGNLAAGRDLCVRLVSQDSKIPDALDLLGRIEGAMGNYSSAYRYVSQALEIRREKHGPDHPKVAESLTHLGRIHGVRDPFEAESLFKSSLSIRERALGPNHPDVAESLTDLASLYQRQNRREEARSLYERSLSIREKVPGPDRWEMVDLLAMLAKLYGDMDQLDTAERAYRRALEIGEKVKGRDSPDIMGIMRHLAHFYQTYGQNDKAALLNERLTGMMEKTLGPDHPDVADNLNVLATIHQFQGHHAEAERGFRRVLKIREKALGRDNPKTGMTVFGLAGVIYAQGRIAESKPHYERSLSILEKDAGMDHPVLVDILNNLAAVYYAEGRYADAEPLFRRTLAIYEKTPGGDRPEMANILDNLSSLYKMLDRPIEAEFYGQRSRKIQEKITGSRKY